MPAAERGELGNQFKKIMGRSSGGLLGYWRTLAFFSWNFLIEIKFMKHKCHHVKVYNLVIFTVFTLLCNHNHYLILGYFHYPRKNSLYPSATTSCSSCQFLANTELLDIFLSSVVFVFLYQERNSQPLPCQAGTVPLSYTLHPPLFTFNSFLQLQHGHLFL